MNGARDEWLKREDSERKTGEWRMPSKREMSREELLGAWVGEEREPSVLADLRPMKTDMESLVGEALASVGQEEMLVLTKLQDHWGEIVEEELAKMSRPMSLFRGCLRVRVMNSSFRFVFERELKGEIMKNVAAASNGLVKKIVYV